MESSTLNIFINVEAEHNGLCGDVDGVWQGVVITTL
jgi:hypothetical protein